MTTQLSRLVEINPSVPEFLADPDAEVTFMPLECVWPDGLADTSRRAKASAVASGYTQFRHGDILLPKITPTFEAGRTFPVQIDTTVGAGTTELHVLRVRPGFDARFVAYVCRSQPFLQDGATRLQGVGNLRRVPPEFIAKFPVQICDPGQQRSIADYLDRETAKIDTLIEEQQRLIGTLRERRRGVIHHLLRPQDGWSEQRIKRVAKTTLGKMLDGGRPIVPGERVTPYVRAADVRGDGSVNLSDLNEMPFSAGELRHFDLRRDDILVIEGGATVGRPGFLHDDVPGVAYQKTVNRVRVQGDTDARFVYWLLLALYESDFYSSYYGAVSFVHLTGEKLREIPLSLPRRDEQRRIAIHLDEATAKVDGLIAETERFIELSRERRAALITAAVTGQIDVRDRVGEGVA